ncbi:uncharacterized protein LOC130624119 [Hydractinia symbiolongicarpus]|uniref:uncharacterized protein LOC130624119 n=1 Tax=Hydractinia symbiolongicarpus TaxID=13093 RepID=UPI00254DC165|nr:uncharacterized protein LOC130624119 [Hydractinia symbiolongicarpus]
MLTLIICQVVDSIYFFDDETRRSEIIDSTDFFKEIENDVKGGKRTDIMSGSGKLTFGDTWCDLVLATADNTITATLDKKNGCNPPSLKMLLDNHFSPNNFQTATKILDGDVFGVGKKFNSRSIKQKKKLQENGRMDGRT